MKSIAMAAILAAGLGQGALAEIYELDAGHTEVRFSYNHAGLTTQNGEWNGVDGKIDFDATDVSATKIFVRIDASSVSTGVVALDSHLKSADFFDVEKFPEITFVSTSAVQTGANSLRMSGDLTIKDITAPAVLDVEMTFQGEHPLGGFVDYYKGSWVGVQATGTVLRSDFGVDMFAPLTSDAVQINISAEMRAGGWSN